MHRAHLPILLFASPAAQALLGRDVAAVGALALRAILRNRKGLEVGISRSGIASTRLRSLPASGAMAT